MLPKETIKEQRTISVLQDIYYACIRFKKNLVYFCTPLENTTENNNHIKETLEQLEKLKKIVENHKEAKEKWSFKPESTWNN